IMPDTDAGVASIVAERIRARVAGEPFPIHKGARAIDITVSIGMAQRGSGDDGADVVIKRADQALYRAKRDGRNRVVLDAA
ncbi:diguanylate cyclase, partial [Klebsiella pneumoniae]|uniref:diguanylate cyclase n=1 Tax=Klebsiella pneumoniae TaxID=573 RepID=UPI0013D13E75